MNTKKQEKEGVFEFKDSNIDQIEGKKGPPKDSTESQIKFVREQIALQTKCINALVEGKGSPASD